jgi:hypothetical protein
MVHRNSLCRLTPRRSRGARAARAASLRAAPQSDAHRAREDFVPSDLAGPRLRRDPAAAPWRAGRDLVPARTAIRCFTSRSAGQRATACSRFGWGRAMARPRRRSWSVATVWSWPSTSTPQRSGSPARTCPGAATPTWSLVHGDGGLGYAEHAPWDRICVTAACPNITPPLIEQLEAPGRLIAPVKEGTRQQLTLLEKIPDGCAARGPHGRLVHLPSGTTRRSRRSGALSKAPTAPPCASSAKSGGEPRSFKSAMRWPTSCDLCYTRARNGNPARTSIAASPPTPTSAWRRWRVVAGPARVSGQA